MVLHCTGSAISMAALGASITSGEWLVHSTHNRWASRLLRWVKTSFPHPKHLLLNLAAPGTTSAYTHPCVLEALPQDVDVVLLEFTFNDFLHRALKGSGDEAVLAAIKCGLGSTAPLKAELPARTVQIFSLETHCAQARARAAHSQNHVCKTRRCCPCPPLLSCPQQRARVCIDAAADILVDARALLAKDGCFAGNWKLRCRPALRALKISTKHRA